MLWGISLIDWICIIIGIIVIAKFGPIDFFTSTNDESDFYGINTSKDPRINSHYDE